MPGPSAPGCGGSTISWGELLALISGEVRRPGREAVLTRFVELDG
jgi:hypothetical protein